ncbi:hypothetical protein V8E55_003492 [Tylopilus felleus]
MAKGGRQVDSRIRGGRCIQVKWCVSFPSPSVVYSFMMGWLLTHHVHDDPIWQDNAPYAAHSSLVLIGAITREWCPRPRHPGHFVLYIPTYECLRIIPFVGKLHVAGLTTPGKILDFAIYFSMSERRMQSSFSLGQKRGGSTSISDPVTDRRSMLGSQIRNVLTKKKQDAFVCLVMVWLVAPVTQRQRRTGHIREADEGPHVEWDTRDRWDATGSNTIIQLKPRAQ